MTSLQSPLRVTDSEAESEVPPPLDTAAGSRPEWVRRAAVGLMALALACSPTYVLRPHIGPFPTTALEILLLVAIPIGLYAFWREVPWANPYLLPGLLLLVAATLDTVVAPDRRAGVRGWEGFFFRAGVVGAGVGP